MHAERAADVDLAGGGQQIVAHHAHDGAGDDAEIFFHRRPALHGADLDVSLLHPVIDHIAELGHLDQRGIGNAAGGDVLANVGEFALHARVIIFQLGDAAENFRQIQRLGGDAVRSSIFSL